MIISLLVVILFLEILLRVIGYSPGYVNPLNSFHIGDEFVGWRGKPSFEARFRKVDFDVTIVTNEEGFRQKESKVKPNPDSGDIIFLGDSFTWGWGVKQGKVFTDVLQDELGPQFNVRNYGVNAYGTVQQRILFEKDLGRIKPASVGIMIFQNDYYDNIDRNDGNPYYIAKGDEIGLANYPVSKPIGGTWRKMRSKSYALTFIAYHFNYFKILKRAKKLESKRSDSGYIALGEVEKKVMERNLVLINAHTKKLGARLFVTYIPMVVELYSDVESPYLKSTREICNKLSVPFLNLVPYFKSGVTNEAGEPYYFLHDEHWTEEGHRLAAYGIRDFILSLE